MFYRTKNYVSKKEKKRQEGAGREKRGLDSCQLIKNNECSRGFNFLPSQQPAQSQQSARGGESRIKHNLHQSVRPVLPTTAHQPLTRNTIASLLSSISPGAEHTLDDSLGLSDTTAFPLVPDTQSHAHLPVLWLMMQIWSVKSP